MAGFPIRFDDFIPALFKYAGENYEELNNIFTSTSIYNVDPSNVDRRTS